LPVEPPIIEQSVETNGKKKILGNGLFHRNRQKKFLENFFFLIFKKVEKL